MEEKDSERDKRSVRKNREREKQREVGGSGLAVFVFFMPGVSRIPGHLSRKEVRRIDCLLCAQHYPWLSVRSPCVCVCVCVCASVYLRGGHKGLDMVKGLSFPIDHCLLCVCVFVSESVRVSVCVCL